MISVPTPHEAADQVRELFQAALACITRGVVGVDPAPPEFDVAIEESIATSGGRVLLSLLYRYLLVHDPTRHRRERWHVRPVSYAYTLDRADGREILAYHWHPAGLSHEHRPHLHIGAGFEAIRPEWQKAHLLTGAVSPAAILELYLTVLGVRPRRSDWPAVLARMASALHVPEPAL